MNKYTAEQITWLRANRSQFPAQQLTEEFNLLFGTSFNTQLIKSICNNHGIPGAGQFRKGGTPAHNWQPIGTERKDDKGYIWVKTAQPNTWKKKSHLVWAQHNPPKPPKHHIIYLDNDRNNVSIANLYLITYAESGILNRHEDWRNLRPEFKKTLINIIRLETATRKKNKSEENQCLKP